MSTNLHTKYTRTFLCEDMTLAEKTDDKEEEGMKKNQSLKAWLILNNLI